MLLLRLGWILRGPSQVRIEGNLNLSAETIFQAAGLRFPQLLLDLDPHQIEQRLVRNLPITSADVERYLLPCNLNIRLTERSPIARATRIGIHGKEEHGLIGHTGYWMPLHIVHRGKQLSSQIFVQGWQLGQRNRIGKILGQRDELGIPLHEILIQPDGSINLIVEGLGLIHLGQDPDHLEQQLEAVRQIGQNLPDRWRGEFVNALDLRNPSEPELQISGLAKTPTNKDP